MALTTGGTILVTRGQKASPVYLRNKFGDNSLVFLGTAALSYSRPTPFRVGRPKTRDWKTRDDHTGGWKTVLISAP